jgi:antitoxin VapB
MDRAKVFWSGRSQAVRLPKAYRFDTSEVTIRREGNTIVLEPAPPAAAEDEWAWLDRLIQPMDEDFKAAVEEPVPYQEPPLDEFFK